MSTTTEALSTAEKARRKAEARRLRILAKSAERLDVVSGLAPKSSPTAADDDAVTAAAASSPAIVSPVADGVVAAAATVASDNAAVAESREPAEEGKSNDTAPEATDAFAAALDSATSSKGSRRMAAMRKRRYQSKNKPKDETGSGETAAKEEEKEKVEAGKEAKIETVAKEDDGKSQSVEKAEPASSEENVAAVPATEQKEEEAKTTPSKTTATTATTTIKDDKATTAPTKTTNAEEKEDSPKKYMGVARMRRKILKEQKAQRLKDISDAEVLGSANHGRSGSDMERELAAEMATMGVTASQVRKGGIVVDESRVDLASVMIGKKRVKWYMKFLPPMKLLPRMVTLLLLFVAGLDLGTQPHRGSGGSPMGASPFSGDLAARDLAGASSAARNLIQHVEPSLTKPWEYGMGGKVAFMVGMAPSSPPTALPTSFDGDMVCVGGDFDTAAGECMATKDKSGNSDTKSGKKEKNKRNKNIIVGQLMEDKLDTSRTRPRGVVSHDDEFADGTTGTVNKAPNIDPLFQVDLDDLLATAQLPAPIKAAAKLAIGFHRTWVYYLWTLPTSAMKSIFSGPKNLLSGWITNPPWILGVVLLIRLVTKMLVGNGKPFSLEPDKDDSSGKDSGGGGNDMDVLGKLTDTAKNYATSSFPRTFLFFTTLWKVMKVDMYVVLCGMLIGLVGPLAREDYFVWKSGSGEGGGGASRPVLGDGEL